MMDSRIKVFKKLIQTYEYWCEVRGIYIRSSSVHLSYSIQKVSKDYDKNFSFPKQHFIVHAIQDILSKGVLRNATTRTGEGFHQEIAQHYSKTNFRDAEGQVRHFLTHSCLFNF
jgi:hypothetical protein